MADNDRRGNGSRPVSQASCTKRCWPPSHWPGSRRQHPSSTALPALAVAIQTGSAPSSLMRTCSRLPRRARSVRPTRSPP